jgi:hypothetical protein
MAYNLSAEAKALLREVSLDKSRLLFLHEERSGLRIETHGNSHTDPSDSRSVARGAAALRELVDAGLVEELLDQGGNLFRLTPQGYLAGD